MKSTGEVMGSDYYLEKPCIKPLKHLLAFAKLWAVLFTIADETKEEALEIAAFFSNWL